MDNKPRRGREFLHSKFINEDRSPARCVVTQTRLGDIHYRAYIQPGERGPATHFIPEAKFPGIVKEWLDEPQSPRTA